MSRVASRIPAGEIPWSGAGGVVQGGEELGVEIGVRVQAAASVRGVAAGRIGEAAAGFLDDEDPGRVIPPVVALDEKRVDVAVPPTAKTAARERQRPPAR